MANDADGTQERLWPLCCALPLQLTWQNQEGFVYDADSFNSLHSFRFTSLRNEGWGITHDGAIGMAGVGLGQTRWCDC